MIDAVVAAKEQWIRDNMVEGLSLCILTDHSDDASEVYMRMKKSKCEEFGIQCDVLTYDEWVELSPHTYHGYIVQLPTKDKRLAELAEQMPMFQDVDALTRYHSASIFQGSPDVLPCTVQACMDMIDFKYKSVRGLDILVIGRSELVGKPLALHLINQGATVTCANSASDIAALIEEPWDIIVCATGHHGVLDTRVLWKPGQLILDVGITRSNGKLVGDVKHDRFVPVPPLTYISPVPKGIGRLTVLNVIANLIKLEKL